MRFLQSSARVALVASVFLCCGAASAAREQSGFYISDSPGTYVEYLSLNVSPHGVSGFLEAIHVSKSAPGGEERKQTFVSSSDGDIIVFGNRTATRNAEGYVLTYATTTGEVGEQRFVRTTAQAVNKSVIALAVEVHRDQTLRDLAATKAELSSTTSVTSGQSSWIAEAQGKVDAALATQSDLQKKTEPLVSIARKLRDEATAEIDKAGASWTQNQKRMAAMEKADQAEQSAFVAQHEADAAGSMAVSAQADLSDLRIWIAKLNERARSLAAKLKASHGLATFNGNGDLAGR